jgi:apolipoprotein N-acyltransferase
VPALKFAAALACGFVLAQSVMWPALAELSWIALTGLVTIGLTTLPRFATTCGIGAGIVFWYTLLGWATATGPAGLGAAALTIAILESFYIAAWMYVVAATRTLHATITVATVGVLWAVEEILRTLGTWAMPYGEVGASQSSTFAGSALQFVGTPGVSFIVVALSYAVARFALAAFYRPSRAAAVASISFALISALAATPLPGRPFAETARVSSLLMVQAPPLRRVDIPALLAFLDRAETGPEQPDAVVLPEDALDFGLSAEDVTQIDGWAARRGTPVIAGNRYRLGAGSVNRAVFFAGDHVLRSYVKQRLVPFGEFVPGKPIFSRIVILPRGDFIAGRRMAAWRLGHSIVAPLICFEIGFGGLARQAAQHADVLVVLLNDAWFSAPEGLSLQYAVARSRARSLGVDVAVAAVRGPSAVFHFDADPTVGRGDSPFARFGLAAPRRTVYARIGDTALLTGAAVLMLYFAIRLVQVAR